MCATCNAGLETRGGVPVLHHGFQERAADTTPAPPPTPPHPTYLLFVSAGVDSAASMTATWMTHVLESLPEVVLDGAVNVPLNLP